MLSEGTVDAQFSSALNEAIIADIHSVSSACATAFRLRPDVEIIKWSDE
jgi:hypothetical protein